MTFSFILIAVAIRVSFLENYIVRDRSFFYGQGGAGGIWGDGGWATPEKEAFEGGGGCPKKKSKKRGRSRAKFCDKNVEI